jgi:hypothetical protein
MGIEGGVKFSVYEKGVKVNAKSVNSALCGQSQLYIDKLVNSRVIC